MAALYQSARPTTFAQVVGQEHVKDVLAAAVQNGGISHAYLFSGPRGVGKTTMARLLAMAVNCEAGPAEAPCGECESCRLVQAGSHPDVMELDAASNNSVEDVRDLLERVGLASMRGGTRVWILDEAHMLTKSAANALLKTLEEPPPGLLFVLATTEPERLPPTILSRCQHFRFRRLTDEQIVSKLEKLAAAKGVTVQQEALGLVARTADGGMRDAETLLERLMVPGATVTLAGAEETLGLPPREQLRALAEALATDDLAALLRESNRMYQAGFAPRTVAEQLARHLREALHEKLAGTPTLSLGEKQLLLALHALDDEQERFVRINDLYSLEVALIKTSNALSGNLPVASAAEKDAPHAQEAAPGAGRSAPPPFEPNARGSRPPKATETKPAGAASATVVPVEDAHGAGSPEASQARRPEERAPARSDAPPTTSQARRSFSWHNVRAKAGPQLKAFLMPAAASLEGDEVTLVYQDTHSFHHSQLLKRVPELEALLEAEVGPGLRLVIEGPGGQRTGSKREAPSNAPKAQKTSPAAKPEPDPDPRPTSQARPAAASEEEPDTTRTRNQALAATVPAATTVATSPRPPGADDDSFIPDDVSFGMEELPDNFWDSPSVAEPEDAPVPKVTAPTVTPADETPRGRRPAGGGVPATPTTAAGAESSEPDEVGETTGPARLEQAFEQLQSLFPGYVVEVRPAAVRAQATEGSEALLDDELDGEDGYDVDDQDRLSFGPAN